MIKPIETRYKGYRFRSRLEARWAVFFDDMRFSWEYEPEGFVLNDGTHYLPDFRVKTPQGKDIWYEIKRGGVFEDAKFSVFCNSHPDHSSFRGALLSGDPIEHFAPKRLPWSSYIIENMVCPRCGFINQPTHCDFSADSEEYFGCEPCDFETPSRGDEEHGIFNMPVQPHKGLVLIPKGLYAKFVKERVNVAARKARSARFEHGERHA